MKYARRHSLWFVFGYNDKQIVKPYLMPWLHAPISSSQRFKNLVRENRTECACSFFPICSDEFFLPACQKTPIRTSDEEIGAYSHGLMRQLKSSKIINFVTEYAAKLLKNTRID